MPARGGRQSPPPPPERTKTFTEADGSLSRECRTCKERFPLNREYWYPRPPGKGWSGPMSLWEYECRSCVGARRRALYERKRDAARAAREWDRAHPEAVLARKLAPPATAASIFDEECTADVKRALIRTAIGRATATKPDVRLLNTLLERILGPSSRATVDSAPLDRFAGLVAAAISANRGDADALGAARSDLGSGGLRAVPGADGVSPGDDAGWDAGPLSGD